MTRERLPNRRSTETSQFRHSMPRGGDGGVFTVSVGRNEVGEIREVFVEPPKKSNDNAHLVRDVALLISIALQHGATIRELQEGVGREEDEARTPQSVAGAVLDHLRSEELGK